MPGRIRIAGWTKDALQRALAAWRPVALAAVADVVAAEDSGKRNRGAIVASVLRAAGDDLAHVIGQAHTTSDKRAWRRS